MEGYHRIESRGIGLWDGSQNGDRWTLFRLGPESHNILRVNNAPQLVKARAEILNSSAGGESPETLVDATPLYEGLATRVTRRFVLENRSRLVIEDTLEGLPENARVSWQMLTPATIEKTAGGVLLRKDGKTLRGKCSPLPREIEVQPVGELMKSYEEPMPGFFMLRFIADVKDGGAFTMRVEFDLG